MGHYRSEMACDTCGNMICTCPKKPDPPQGHLWVVGFDNKVVTLAQWSADYPSSGHEPAMRNFHLMMMKRFPTKDAAERTLSERLVHDIMEAERNLQLLVRAHDALPCNKATPWRLNSEGI